MRDFGSHTTGFAAFEEARLPNGGGGMNFRQPAQGHTESPISSTDTAELTPSIFGRGQ